METFIGILIVIGFFGGIALLSWILNKPKKVYPIGCIAANIILDLDRSNIDKWVIIETQYVGEVQFAENTEKKYTLKIEEDMFEGFVWVSLKGIPSVYFNDTEKGKILDAFWALHQEKEQITKRKQLENEQKQLKSAFPDCFVTLDTID
jgi:hypothetical protein